MADIKLTTDANINALIERSKAMLAQTKAEGAKPFAGSSYDKPLGFVSSNSVVNQQQQQQAVGAGVNALTTTTPTNTPKGYSVNTNGDIIDTSTGQTIGTSKTTTTGDLTKRGMDIDQTEFERQQQLAEQQIQLLDMQYNADTANLNRQYANLFDDLKQQQVKTLNLVKTQAAQLNPYSGPSSSQTGYIQKINDNINNQARKLQEQADAAQQQLQLGNMKGHLAVQQQMASDYANFKKQQNDLLLGLAKEQSDQQRFEITQYGQNMRAASDDYRSYLKEVPYSPAEIKTMTDEQLLSTTAGRLAAAANPGVPLENLAAQVRIDMSESSYRSQQIANTAQRNQDLMTIALAKLASAGDEEVSSKAYILAGVGSGGTDVAFYPKKKLRVFEQQKINTVMSSVNLINQAEALYATAAGEEYSGMGSGVASRLKGLYRGAAGTAGIDQSWKAYQNFLDSNKAPIAKGIKGEVGNLAAAEQADAMKSFPSKFSSPYEASIAFSTVRSQLLGNLATLGYTEPTGSSSAGSQQVNTNQQSNNPVGI